MDINKLIEENMQITLDKKSIQFLSDNIKEVDFEKNSCPVKEGDVMNNFYFIISGLVRGFYIDENGNEVTKCFSCECQ